MKPQHSFDIEAETLLRKNALLQACLIAEEALGENLQFLYDKFDLEIRQKDKVTEEKLTKLLEAWTVLVNAINNENKGKY